MSDLRSILEGPPPLGLILNCLEDIAFVTAELKASLRKHV